MRNAARLLSTLGHPLVAGALFLGVVIARLYNRTDAAAMGAALLLALLAPIAIWIQWQVRRGRYSDFDVSRQADRFSMYPVIVGLLTLSTLTMALTHQPRQFSLGMGAACAMTLICFLANRWIKISVHASFGFFLALVSVKLSPAWVAPALVLATLVALSRLYLRRHQWSEVMCGAVLGVATAMGLLALIGLVPV